MPKSATLLKTASIPAWSPADAERDLLGSFDAWLTAWRMAFEAEQRLGELIQQGAPRDTRGETVFNAVYADGRAS